jgi:hypothetical protein
MKKIAILQSNYIPWKGYFDLIAAVDEFIIYDDVQYTKNDWRNRNQIKTSNGLKWLTIPVYYEFKKDNTQKICETETKGTDWAAEHWKTLTMCYKKAPFFKEIAEWLEPLYANILTTNLSQINRLLIEAICKYIGIKTKISYSWDYKLTEGKSARLVDLCLQTGGTEYISGPAAKAYLEENLFVEKGIKVTWFDYTGYPEYTQLCGEFCHNVSILDVLFCCGNKTSGYMKYTLK